MTNLHRWRSGARRKRGERSTWESSSAPFSPLYPFRDPRELLSQLVIHPRRVRKDNPRCLELRVCRLPLCPAGLGTERTRGVNEFLSGELGVGVGHHGGLWRQAGVTSKLGVPVLYTTAPWL